MVFVTKLLLVKVSCNMGANNTITTASSSSSGVPQRPTSFLNLKYLFSHNTVVITGIEEFEETEMSKGQQLFEMSG